MSEPESETGPSLRRAGGRASSHAYAKAAHDARASVGQPTDVKSAVWPGLELSVHDTLAELESAWRSFERRAHCTAFQTFDWLSKWQHHIGALNGTDPVIVCGHDEVGELLFLLPLAIARRGTIRRLIWLGSALCDYNGPLVAEEFAAHCTAERFRGLWVEIVAILRAQERTRFDLIDLEKMPEEVGTRRNPFVDLPVQLHPSGAHLCQLGSNWDQFYTAKRSSSTRKRDRHRLKRFAKLGEIRFVDVQERDEAERTLEILGAQKERSLARMGVRNLITQPGLRAFLLDVATDSGTKNFVHLNRFDVGATPAAISFSLEFKNRYYVVLLSHDDSAVAKFGPGKTHMNYLIQRAIEQGMDWFDFTIGDEPYKIEWSNLQLNLYDYLAPATVRGHFTAGFISPLRRVKRFIKQTPWAWSVFSKARASLGGIVRR